LLSSIAAVLTAQTPAWDTSGNGMLKGTYYFRQVVYELSSAGDGTLNNALAFYGTATFSGTGTYTMVVTLLDGQSGQFTRGNVNNGTYSIAASGEGFLSSPLFPGSGSISKLGNPLFGLVFNFVRRATAIASSCGHTPCTT